MVTQKDIHNWILQNFPSTRPQGIWFDEGLPGTLKIIIDHINREEQIEIHEQLMSLLPVGIRLDVHRGQSPPVHTTTPININRPPVWDVGDE